MNWNAVRVLAAGILFLPQLATPQGETTSAIVGRVADQSGAPISAAAITLIGLDTGLRRTALTGDTGRFTFPQLKPGAYALDATARGFEPQRRPSISAAVGQTHTIDFTLGLAASRQKIEVTGEAPLINTDNPNTSTTLAAVAIFFQANRVVRVEFLGGAR